MNRVAIYVRVSTKEQAEEGYSIGVQLEKLKTYCEVKGWHVHDEYVDGGYSGAKLERPAMQKLIDDAKNKKIDMVLVYKLDRLSRSQKDTLYLIEDVFHPNDVKFASLQENFDTSTPLGMAMVGILSVFAQLERAQIRERMKLGLDARASEGLWHGGGYDPIGYDYIQGNGVKGGGKLVINEYEALQVRKIFDLFEAETPITQIQNYMKSKYTNKHGSWRSSSSIISVLTTPIVCGMIKTKDGYVQGQHEAIISQERFNRTQDLLAKRRKLLDQKGIGSGFQITSLLGGLLYCGNCGARYYIKTVNSGRRKESKRLIRYYTCYSRGKTSKRFIIDPNCKNITVEESRLDKLVIDEICKLQLIPEEIDEIKSETNEVEVITNRIDELKKKKAKLIDLYTLDVISIDDIQDKIESIQSEIDSLENDLSFDCKPLISVAEAKETIIDAKRIFETGTYEEKRYLITTLIERITLYDDRIEIHWNFE